MPKYLLAATIIALLTLSGLNPISSQGSETYTVRVMDKDSTPIESVLIFPKKEKDNG